MPYFEFKNIKISAVASAVPTTVVNNDDYKALFGEKTVEDFKAKVGVKEYRKAGKNQTVSDLGYVAAEKIIQEKNIDREEIDALVLATHSTDYRRPATACVLHHRLKLSKDCAAFDINLGCSAFVYGLQVVCSMMQCSDIRKALLIVGETMTKYVNEKDHSSTMLFGDAGSAVLLERTESGDPISGIVRTDGDGYRSIIVPAGGFRNMDASGDIFMWPDQNERTLYNVVMNGSDVFTFSIFEVPDLVNDYFDKTQTTVDDYDCYAFHQANQFILKQLKKSLKIPNEKYPICLDRYGNTSAAAIPLVLSDKYGNDNASDAQRILMSGFGVGLSWGVAAASICPCDIYPVIETDEVFVEGIINSPSDM